MSALQPTELQPSFTTAQMQDRAQLLDLTPPTHTVSTELVYPVTDLAEAFEEAALECGMKVRCDYTEAEEKSAIPGEIARIAVKIGAHGGIRFTQMTWRQRWVRWLAKLDL